MDYAVGPSRLDGSLGDHLKDPAGEYYHDAGPLFKKPNVNDPKKSSELPSDTPTNGDISLFNPDGTGDLSISLAGAGTDSLVANFDPSSASTDYSAFLPSSDAGSYATAGFDTTNTIADTDLNSNLLASNDPNADLFTGTDLWTDGTGSSSGSNVANVDYGSNLALNPDDGWLSGKRSRRSARDFRMPS